jgi:hypothetical protein
MPTCLIDFAAKTADQQARIGFEGWGTDAEAQSEIWTIISFLRNVESRPN